MSGEELMLRRQLTKKLLQIMFFFHDELGRPRKIQQSHVLKRYSMHWSLNNPMAKTGFYYQKPLYKSCELIKPRHFFFASISLVCQELRVREKEMNRTRIQSQLISRNQSSISKLSLINYIWDELSKLKGGILRSLIRRLLLIKKNDCLDSTNIVLLKLKKKCRHVLSAWIDQNNITFSNKNYCSLRARQNLQVWNKL